MNPDEPTRRMEEVPETYYAPAGRASKGDLRKAIAFASHNAVIDAVLRTFGGLLAVLNEQRQVLAVNEALLKALGLEDATGVLGLRLGEAAGCVHAQEHPGGCGTGRYCSNCGAAVAMVTALAEGSPTERECVLTATRDGRTEDFDFAVRCCPIDMEGRRLLLVFLRDIGEEKRRGSLERTFFHDVNNLLTALLAASDLLVREFPGHDTVGQIRQALALFAKEVEWQKVLSGTTLDSQMFMPQETTVNRLLESVQMIYLTHPAARDKVLLVSCLDEDIRVVTDPSLVIRVLMNMVTNALEATPPGEAARLRASGGEGVVTFSVWNCGAIPADVAQRVFQRYFTSKPGVGRGLGTFAMKWLTENYLNGQVGFTSTPAEGTTFWLRLPERLEG